MFTVYVLYSPAFDKIYIGFTKNIEARFLSHNKLGKKGWTIKFRPWQILYTEGFTVKEKAMIREKELKSAKGRSFIRSEVRTLPSQLEASFEAFFVFVLVILFPADRADFGDRWFIFNIAVIWL